MSFSSGIPTILLMFSANGPTRPVLSTSSGMSVLPNASPVLL